jgi:hypothetical protein
MCLPGRWRRPAASRGSHYVSGKNIGEQFISRPIHDVDPIAVKKFCIFLIGMPSEPLIEYCGEHQIPLTRADTELIQINQRRPSELIEKNVSDAGIAMHMTGFKTEFQISVTLLQARKSATQEGAISFGDRSCR